MSEFDDLFLDTADAVRKSGKYILAGIGKVVSALVILLAAIVTFTDITLGDIGTAAFGVTFAVFTFAASTVFFAMESEGERRGEATDAAKTIFGALEEKRGRIGGADMEAFHDFLFRASDAEATRRRNEFLASAGETPDSYAAFQNGAPACRARRRVFRRAKRIRRVPLSPASFFLKGKSGSELRDPTRTKILRHTVKLLPSLVGMTLTVSVMITFKTGLSPDALLEGVFRLVTLLLIGLRGYLCGYVFVTERLVPFTETKCKLLDAFLAEKAILPTP